MEGNIPQLDDERDNFSDESIAKLLSTGQIRWDEKTQNFIFTGKSKKATLKKATVDIPDDIADDVADDDPLKDLYVKPEEMVKPNEKTTLKKATRKKPSPILNDIVIGSKVVFTKKGKEYTGIVEKETPKNYKICCKPGKNSGEKNSLYMVPKEYVKLVNSSSLESKKKAALTLQKMYRSKKQKSTKVKPTKVKPTKVIGFYSYAMPKNDDNTVDYEHINKLNVYMKCEDIINLIKYTKDKKHFNTDNEYDDYILLIKPFIYYMNSLVNLFKNIPEIRKKIKKKPMCFKSDPKNVTHCSKCDEESVLRILNRMIHKITGKVIHCELAYEVVRRVSQPLKMYPEILFSMAENTLDIIYSNLFTYDGNKLNTIEESRLKLMSHSRPIVGAITSGGCFENSLRNLSEDVFTSNVIFEIDSEDTIQNNISNNINIMLHYLCKNSLDPNYNNLIKPWTPMYEKYGFGIDWILDHFDNQEGLIRILKENNIIGRQCSDGIITEESVKETIEWLLELFAINDDLPWLGKCEIDGVKKPCRNIDEYRTAINNDCLQRNDW